MTESGQRPLKILTSLQGIKDMLDKHTEKNTEKGEIGVERRRARKGKRKRGR